MIGKKKIVFVLLVMFLIAQLSGEGKAVAVITAAGELSIPSADGKNKLYNGVITISRKEITIECKEKIFRLFNDFDTPRKPRIKIDMAEVIRITLMKNAVIIFPTLSLYSRYRNILIHVVIHTLMSQQEKFVFIFFTDIEALEKQIMNKEKNLINRLNNRNDPDCRLCGWIIPYLWGQS